MYMKYQNIIGKAFLTCLTIGPIWLFTSYYLRVPWLTTMHSYTALKNSSDVVFFGLISVVAKILFKDASITAQSLFAFFVLLSSSSIKTCSKPFTFSHSALHLILSSFSLLCSFLSFYHLCFLFQSLLIFFLFFHLFLPH